jgi:hypothetical protein
MESEAGRKCTQNTTKQNDKERAWSWKDKKRRETQGHPLYRWLNKIKNMDSLLEGSRWSECWHTIDTLPATFLLFFAVAHGRRPMSAERLGAHWFILEMRYSCSCFR